jgi:Carboxypeptidase regulatory-like domain/TonB dependent receptor
MAQASAARAAWLMAVTLLWLVVPASSLAQVSTATIQGTVTDASGVLPGATVTAREIQSGFTHEAASGTDGSFTLAGLRPGRYEITVAVSQYKPEAKTVEVLVGQAVTLNFRINPDVVVTESVTVVGDTRLVDTRTSEVTTNVTQEQLRYLPQNSRNFLNFAALAPGVRVSDNEFRKEFSAGALPSQNVNVFIDGVSFKNDVIDGGVIGQDSSRGNPFPQSAVQEFQVLTQNFKAEYEKAASAIITAVTKSGGNRFTGELFSYYQDKALVENEAIVRDAANLFVKGETTPKPAYERWQWGFALGGPIVRDRMQFFASYEENRQERAGNVLVGTVSTAPESLVQRLRAFEGLFISPFREKLLFAKTSFQPRQGQQAEITYNWRNETDIRGFGGQGASNSFQTAENVHNRVDSLQGKWQIAQPRFLNEAYLSYQRYRWNPKPENPDIIGENFSGLMRIGGRDTEQFIVQQRVSLRDDFSQFLKWHGSHTAKVGGVVSFVDYDVNKKFNGNPLFTYRGDISWDFPASANYGAGNPDLSAKNYQFGVFAQDDWAIGPRLTINLGLRWDYESDMLNNDYVTPENVRAATAPFVDNARYFTDGDDRPPFYSAWQPRVGFSYDITGKGQTIAFGGWGRYYDRVLYNSTLDERFRLQYATRTFQFSRDGSIRDGVQTIVWDPSYLSVAGLESIIAQGRAPNPEVFLIANDAKPPRSDQWSLGLRQSFKGVVTSVTYTGTRSQDLFTFIFGTRRPDGTCCLTVPGYSNILMSDPDGRKAWFDGLYVQVDKPYGGGGRVKYGYSLTYTLGRSEQNGGDLFSLDFPRVSDYPRYPTGSDERHRLVMTGIFGLPYGFIASTFITLGSGTPYTIDDQSLGGGVNERVLQRNGGRPEQFTFIFPDAWAYRSVDLHLEKGFHFGSQVVSVIFQGFNIFSFDNFSGYQGFIPTLPATNPNYGRPSNLIDPGRRLQFGLRYGF